MNFKPKLLLGLGGAGTVGGIGAASYPYLSKGEKESILTAITKQGKRFILSTSKSTHDTQWTAISDSLKNDAVARREIENPIDKDRLKRWCEDTSQKKSYDEDLLKKFENRCTKNTLLTEVKEKLEQGKALIQFGDDEGWKARYESYKTDATDTNMQITINGQKISNTGMSNQSANDVRDWCQSMNNSLFEGDSSNSYTSFKKWCVKEVTR
ncbi:hypothetical protein HF1_01900 [Mycoplasma haemofelis str. Langford 1]|uniref:Uncharacterized protein n=1 Tax=Mycoplasma haemofelis (strain Langford 1) TaxID=941640 RepID=E8ZKN2_MYCHL|nr:hypothetical protein [Mycoplasma haemofelis]CBY92198.1 hypothetical protein HF1_01900 [Mycoplasma haemofelis str. Langford 1]